MCLSQKKHFYRPLKMLYRYKSKWYMPTDVQFKYGLSKAKLMQKDLKKFHKKNRDKLLSQFKFQNKKNNQKVKGFNFASTLAPTLIKQKHSFFGKRKYNRAKLIPNKMKLKKQKFIIKKYLKKIINEKFNENTKENKIKIIMNALHTLNVFYIKQRAIHNLRNIKNKILFKNELNQELKKRMGNTFQLTSKYFLNYPTFQTNIFAASNLLQYKKKTKKNYLLLNYLKAKQSFVIYKAKEREHFVYNEDILDSNFMESNLRENYGITPAKNISDYVLNKIFFKLGFFPSKYTLQQKKRLQFRLKKNKYKKNYDKMYYKKRRLVFQDRSYNRFGLNDIKKTKLKIKRQPVSLLNLSRVKNELILTSKQWDKALFSGLKLQLRARKKNKSLLFLNPANYIAKMQRSLLLKSKIYLNTAIKQKFINFVRLIKIELKKNTKIIKKFTKKLLFLKKQKGLFYRKKKIETLNLRDYFIKENQKLREEIKNYSYTWKNSPFFNYKQTKQIYLKSIIDFRKKKYNLAKLMQKYPEGSGAFKERLKNKQYYTGLSLLKRKLE